MSSQPPVRRWIDGWHISSATNKDYDFLDGLRGLAILMVVACHFITAKPTDSTAVRFVGGIFSAGTTGVPLFFALSAFLISLPFWRRKISGAPSFTPVGYGWRRFYKIYPPLALSIVVLTPLFIAFGGQASACLLAAAQWLTGLTLVTPALGTMNPVMWSLVAEVEFYLLIPLIFFLTRRCSAAVCTWLIPASLLGIGVIARAVFLAFGCRFTLHPLLFVPPLSMSDSFAGGVLVAGLVSRGGLNGRWAVLGDVGFALFILQLFGRSVISLAELSENLWLTEMLSAATKIAVTLMLCYVADPRRLVPRFFDGAPIRWCGIISYEWYLFHQAVAGFVFSIFGASHGNLLKYFLLLSFNLAFTLLLAACIYKYFSLPILARGRQLHSGR